MNDRFLLVLMLIWDIVVLAAACYMSIHESPWYMLLLTLVTWPEKE